MSVGRAVLLQMRAQLDELIGETTPAVAPVTEATWMRISEFARTHRYSPKTVSQWCRLGMPHIGKGHHCRVDVRAAEKWIADGGATRAAATMGRIAHMKETQG
jgi:hypothetical protein